MLAAVAALSVHVSTAQALPPVGCYGLPSVPAAFVCVTEFTPGNAVPGATVDPENGTVTVPAFCAGDCYGPFTVPVPGVDLSSSSGAVAVVTYQGESYAIVVGQTPPLGVPDVPDLSGLLPQFADCPGEPVVRETSPVVCFHENYYGTTWYVGTCLTDPCTYLSIRQDLIERLPGLIADIVDDPGYVCDRLTVC